mmetsp:Transcript_34369/g.58878  ORF Transcript_34369/g.58878 Transcript_34369/m.58878 type:complete len:89 (+) Transcript_34369:269-535(+)
MTSSRSSRPSIALVARSSPQSRARRRSTADSLTLGRAIAAADLSAETDGKDCDTLANELGALRGALRASRIACQAAVRLAICELLDGS